MRRFSNVVALIGVLPIVGWIACSSLKATGPDVQSVSVALSQSSLPVGQSVTVVATLRDADGFIVDGPIDWSLTNPAVASRISASGNTAVYTGMVAGATEITATSSGASGSAMLTVTGTTPPPGAPPVASVSVALGSASRTVGQTTQATATTRDANNNVLTGRAVSWSSSNNAVATVSSSGLVSAAGSGSAQIIATSEGQSGSATLTVTGAPPAPVATVTVSLASSALVTGGTTQASATTRDANNNVLTGRAVTWASDNTAVATVSGSGLVAATGPGSAQITATSEGQSGSATVTVTTPPPPPPGGSNEPAGMTVITDRPFNSTTPTYTPGEAGWEDWSGTTYLTIVQDATAPKSPSNVGQLRYPAGYSGGNAPGGSEYNLRSGGRAATTIYIAMWVKLSSNWYGNPSGVNKLLHVWIAGVNRLVASATGEANGPLVPQIRLQTLGGLYMGAEDANLNPNIAGQTNVKIIRGQWHKWEIISSGGTPGGANGTVDWFIDGVQVGHYTGVPYIQPGGSTTWDVFKWDPTWGGIGGTVPADQFMWVDHLYISGKP
jgi:uncharacterized protein YjdB